MIFASNNKNKIEQVKEYAGEDIKGLKEAGIDIDVEEDGKTFEENAVKKAKEIFKIANVEVIADDSGLCIDALDGWPGVMTHRFLGEEATEEDALEASTAANGWASCLFLGFFSRYIKHAPRELGLDDSGISNSSPFPRELGIFPQSASWCGCYIGRSIPQY